MIYTTKHNRYNINNFEKSNYLELHPDDSFNFSAEEETIIESLAQSLSQPLNEYALLIPKKWARGESNEALGRQEDIARIPHYELHIERQIGSWKTRKDTYVYLRLPKSRMLVNIVLHVDGGVSFDPKFHKYVLRETDALDRRIIMGFCNKYHQFLVQACHSDKGRDPYLDRSASYYKASDSPKRLKYGSNGRDLSDFYRLNGGLEPYEESSIFKDVVFI